MRVLSVFIALSLSPLFATQDADFPPYNSQTVSTFKGQIVSVQRYNFVNKPAPYIQFILHTEGKDYTILAGPEWYVSSQGMILVTGEKIEVEGSLITINGKEIVLAQVLKKEGSVLKLRDKNGTPIWL
jgi:hypothetical protein